VDVCCDICVLSGRGLCVGLITIPELSYRVWCVLCECDHEASIMTGPWPTTGRCAMEMRTQRDVLTTSIIEGFSIALSQRYYETIYMSYLPYLQLF
jgi:hypothetical protein